MLVCQLPAASRRLPRPSSPVIAKASTTCTYSLDPIALSNRQDSHRTHWLQVCFLALALRALALKAKAQMQSLNPVTPLISEPALPANRPRLHPAPHKAYRALPSSGVIDFFQIVK